MDTKLPPPPLEVQVCRDLDLLAPKFAAALHRVLMRLIAKDWHPKVLETHRTEERAKYLYGFGREYDDGRGIVTNVPTALKGWHGFGLAADIGDRRYPDGAPAQFYADLRECAEAEGLTSGSDWDRDGIPVPQDPDEHFCDNPHVQWFCPGMHVSPSPHAAALLASGGVEAVWRELHASED